jgi:hypothetical protein
MRAAFVRGVAFMYDCYSLAWMHSLLSIAILDTTLVMASFTFGAFRLVSGVLHSLATVIVYGRRRSHALHSRDGVANVTDTVRRPL